MTVLTLHHLLPQEKAKRRRKPHHPHPQRLTRNRRTITRRSRDVDDTQRIRKRRRSTKLLPSIQSTTMGSTFSLTLLSATRTSGANSMRGIANAVVTFVFVSSSRTSSLLTIPLIVLRRRRAASETSPTATVAVAEEECHTVSCTEEEGDIKTSV